MDRRFIIIMSVIILAFVGIFTYSAITNDKSASSGEPSNHVLGENNKGVELAVYGDFECPACAEYYTIEKGVIEKYKADIAFVFNHFPLDNIHPNARAASRAAEAAGAQGKFFEMHDLLYENQSLWSSQATTNPRPIFDSFAKQLNLDLAQFDEVYTSEATNSTINADRAEGNKLGVTGTPTYYINGTKVNLNDVRSIDDFSKLIDEAIAAKNP